MDSALNNNHDVNRENKIIEVVDRELLGQFNADPVVNSGNPVEAQRSAAEAAKLLEQLLLLEKS